MKSRCTEPKLIRVEIETYDEALTFLGAQKDTQDDFILTLVQVKASDNPLNAELAQSALAVIAKARNSEALRQGSRSGMAGPSMTPQQAYALLGIGDPSATDDELITLSHQVAVDDAPGRASELNEALSVIAENRKSQSLRYQVSSLTGNAIHVGPSPGDTAGYRNPPQEEPRGLNNIGNTCYLNSLLQYLFTVKPVRDMVEHFDEYKQDLPEHGKLFEKKVADMKVDREGVVRTQACEYL